MSLNYQRRYKWLCVPTEDDPDALLFDLPSLHDFYDAKNKLSDVSRFYDLLHVTNEEPRQTR